jgi:hypothetical protein
VNEFFVYVLQAALTQAFVYYAFDEARLCGRMLRRAVDIAATLDNSSVVQVANQYADIHFTSLKVYLLYGKVALERGK